MPVVVRLGAVAAALALALCIALGVAGCIDALALQAVRAPNYGRSVADLQDVTVSPDDGSRWRLEVGPPRASLAVRVFEPMRAIVVCRQERYPWVRYWLRRWTNRPPHRGVSKQLRGTILVLHGLHQRKEGLAPLAGYLADQGYRVVLVDLRGQGHSTGNWLTYGSVETRDMIQLIDELERRGLVTGRLGVLGLSYGGGLAIQLAAADPRVTAVVAAEPYASMRDVAADAAPIFMGFWQWLYSDSLVDMGLNRMARLTGCAPGQPAPLLAIQRTEAPILLIHGEEDLFVKPRQSRLLLQARAQNTGFVLVPDVGHVALYLRAVELVGPRARAWFDEYLRPPQPSLPLVRADGPVGDDSAEGQAGGPAGREGLAAGG